MKISFQKLIGNPDLGIAFYWKMTIDADASILITDYFIPELFYDYFYIQSGKIQVIDTSNEACFQLPEHALKTLHTHRITLNISAPLVLYGTRFNLKFAETFWQPTIPSNSFLVEKLVTASVNDLHDFASQISATVQNKRSSKTVAPMFMQPLKETVWLSSYSVRHKHRLYKSVFGLSKKEMMAIQNVHSFLAQTCDFSSQSPHIIQYVNSEVFYDQPHLNHSFKKMTGFSLMDYFEAHTIIQDNLMAASYNEISTPTDTI